MVSFPFSCLISCLKFEWSSWRALFLTWDLQQGVLALFESGLQLPEQEALLLNQRVKITLESFSLWLVESLDSGWSVIFKNILAWSSVLKFPLSKLGSCRSAQLTGWIFSSSVWQFFLSSWPSYDCQGFLDCCISSASPANFLDKMMKSVLPLFALIVKLVLLKDQKLSSSIWFLVSNEVVLFN